MKMKRTALIFRASSRCILIVSLLAAGCAHREKPALEDLSGHEDLSRFKIQSVTGVRDGDKLNAQVLISDSSSILTLDLHFAIGSPTTLTSGEWRWSRSGQLAQGNVRAESVSFLGGQDDGPSIGGVFGLVLTDAGFRVNLPLTVLPRSFRPATPAP